MKKIILLGLLFCTWANAKDRLEQLADTLSGAPIESYKEIEIPRTSIEYSIDRDQWESGRCDKDRFTGAKLCEIRNRNLTVVKRNGVILVFVLGSDYPGKNAAIKIDNNKTFYGKEGVFNETSQIISQMSKGNIAYTRAIKWPYLNPSDNEVDLTGFKEAYSKMLKEYSAIP